MFLVLQREILHNYTMPSVKSDRHHFVNPASVSTLRAILL